MAWHPNSEKEKDPSVAELAKSCGFAMVPRHVQHGGSWSEMMTERFLFLPRSAVCW